MSNDLTVIDQREVTFYGDDLMAVKAADSLCLVGGFSGRMANVRVKLMRCFPLWRAKIEAQHE